MPKVESLVPAYHWVPKSAFHSVLEKGYLTPAIERLSPGFFREKCDDEFENIGGIAYETSRPVNPVSLEAAKRLVNDRIEDLFQWSRGGFSREEFSQLGCIDLMAGDHELVFLQVGRWIDWGGNQKPTGFVFDAASLIREGAVLRKKDLAPLYWDGLNRFLLKDHGSLDHAEDVLVQVFAGIQRANELRGAAAIKALSRLGKRGASELLWNGRLPISLAVESFHPDLYLEA